MTEDFLIQELKDRFKGRDFFSREELYNFFLKYNPTLSENTFRWRIFDLKQKRIIRSISKAVFSLQYHPAFIPSIEPKTKNIFKEVKKQFPHTKLSIWNTKWLNELMLHQPGRFMTILEIESDAAKSVFNYFKDSGQRNVFFEPRKKEIENYISDNNDPIIISKLLTKSPTVLVDNITVPSLEKILVDIYADPVLYSAFQGNELTVIFENAFNKYEVNATRLYSYAARRNKKNELEKFILSNTDFPINVLK